MGAVYSITLRIKPIDEASLVETLKKFVTEPNKELCANFCLDDFAKEGVGTDTLEDLIKIIFAGWKECNITFKPVGGTSWQGFTRVTNCFDASYGWEMVMIEAFKAMAPYLENRSSMYIYPDEDYDYLVVKDGKAIWKH